MAVPQDTRKFMKRQDSVPLPSQTEPTRDMLPAGSTEVVIDGTVIPPLSERTLAEMRVGQRTLGKYHAGAPPDEHQS
jgi:hypothetical protein